MNTCVFYSMKNWTVVTAVCLLSEGQGSPNFLRKFGVFQKDDLPESTEFFSGVPESVVKEV